MHDHWLILELALGLVVFTVVGVGLFVHWMIPAMPVAVCFALASVLSPTDPIAVSDIAARVPIPKRMMRILQAESFLNDASGLIPSLIDHNSCAHCRNPMDMIFQGRSTRVFQAKQQ